MTQNVMSVKSGGAISVSRPQVHLEHCLLSHPQEWNDVVFGNSLQKSGSPSEGLKACPNSREERADDNNPRRRPGQRPHHQIFLNGVSKPTRKRILNVQYYNELLFHRSFFFIYTLLMITSSRTQVNSLVPEDYSFNAGPKKDHRTEI